MGPHPRLAGNASPPRPASKPHKPQGFELGIRTMRVGGKRRIIVPPKLGPPIGPSTFFSAKQCEASPGGGGSVAGATPRGGGERGWGDAPPRARR